MKKEKHTSVVFETDTYHRLVALAAEDKRPVSNLIRYIVTLYITGIDNGSIRLCIYTRLKKQS